MQPPDEQGNEAGSPNENVGETSQIDEVGEAAIDGAEAGASASVVQAPESRETRRPWWPWFVSAGALAWALGWFFRLSSAPGDLPAAAIPGEAAEVEVVAEVAVEPNAEVALDPNAEAIAEADAKFEANTEIPELSPWLSSKDLHDPNVVTYTMRFGGSLERVANLFKIFHHEITALNPGLALKKDLPRDSKIVLYRRDPKLKSESIGFPDDGALKGAVPMVEGPGRKLSAVGWKRWATASTVATLDQVLRRWSERPQSTQPVLVGNMSARTGGKLAPHGSHRSGRDVDLGYIQKDGVYDEHNWRAMDAHNLDAGETWELIRLLLGTGKLEAIFVDRAIQKLLYDFAVAKRIYNKHQLARLIEYPRATGSTTALIVHVNGHIDHLHARFGCPSDQPKCKSRPRQDR